MSATHLPVSLLLRVFSWVSASPCSALCVTAPPVPQLLPTSKLRLRAHSPPEKTLTRPTTQTAWIKTPSLSVQSDPCRHPELPLPLPCSQPSVAPQRPRTKSKPLNLVFKTLLCTALPLPTPRVSRFMLPQHPSVCTFLTGQGITWFGCPVHSNLQPPAPSHPYPS